MPRHMEMGESLTSLTLSFSAEILKLGLELDELHFPFSFKTL